MDPVLPAGFGYAIIANDGRVLFHSDEALHLGENLFQECDEDPHLRSATMGRGDTALNAFYLGEEHRFFITTLEGFPDWSLVVFRNKEPLRSAFFELLTSVTVLILIYGLVLMAGFSPRAISSRWRIVVSKTTPSSISSSLAISMPICSPSYEYTRSLSRGISTTLRAPSVAMAALKTTSDA